MSERFSFLDKTMKDVQVNNSILLKEEFNKCKKLHDEKKLKYRDVIKKYFDSDSTMFYQHYKPVEVPTADSFDDSIPASEVKDTINRYETARELESKSYTSFNLYDEVFKLLAIEFIKEEYADRKLTDIQARDILLRAGFYRIFKSIWEVENF